MAEILVEVGFKEVKPDTDLDSCGSIHSIYASYDSRFMIQWDGEERFGSVEFWEDDSWKMLEPIVPEGSVQIFDNNLAALCLSVENHL
ncbi:hypothetical protein L1D15_21310 [Vibrio sp. Isolate25]|uniref:hypothetical protein n=1 Tax=Vibrio sp. Isolate25 TaxID=2908535 RepID=UPI001EFE3BF6|nr:hypothetical protein [Vibrio sp. Isolate25]MCG9599231.1 hypothetical protein [Vibrio sp. Isolate25]